ncbi:MAG TPA: molecular chaperone TorD family protein [Rubrivivax sp.]|nr:molecular chaperone TorD family protein [Rubrivivax sp.]HPO18767.1 molecular chaperone TorD family protein [Rubrivivax sp.]
MTPPGSLRDAADDLRTLAWLHAAEQPPAAWLALHEAGFPAGLSVLSVQDAAMAQMCSALRLLRAACDADAQRAADDLAADFAAIYLTHHIQASPYESVWLDEDHLLLQGPTFAVREAYRKHGLGAPDWRMLPDDHLTHQLSFVAALLDKGALDEARDFMAQHLMRWLPRFAERVAQRAGTPIYAALATLTLQVCRGVEQALPAAAPQPA